MNGYWFKSSLFEIDPREDDESNDAQADSVLSPSIRDFLTGLPSRAVAV